MDNKQAALIELAGSRHWFLMNKEAEDTITEMVNEAIRMSGPQATEQFQRVQGIREFWDRFKQRVESAANLAPTPEFIDVAME